MPCLMIAFDGIVTYYFYKATRNVSLEQKVHLIKLICLIMDIVRFTCKAQEEAMEALDNDVKTIFNAEIPTDVSKVQQVWSNYVQELCKFESILPTLMQVSLLVHIAFALPSTQS